MDKRITLVFLFLVSLFIVSCSNRVTNVYIGENVVIYPSPPDTTRIQYLTSINNSEDIKGKQSGFNKAIFGASVPIAIVKPYGLAVQKGRIFVCDAGIAGLEVMDLKEKSFNVFIPKGRGQLKTPVNCSVDASGMLYVADPSRRQIVIFDSIGQYVDAFGDTTANAKPTDVAVLGDKIWVPDAAHNKVNVYQKNTRGFLFSFPDSTQTGEGHLFQPVNICVTEKAVYVTDFGDFKVKSYTLTGEFLASVGEFGSAFGQLVRPKGIAVDKDDNLMVVDAQFDNVQIFNKSGQLLMFFGGANKGPGSMYLPAKVTVDYENLEYFSKFVDPAFTLKYLVYVTNQYGTDKINVYGAVESKKK